MNLRNLDKNLKVFCHIKCEFGYFRDTLYRWYTEGLPTDKNIEELKNANPEPGVPGGWGPVNINLHPQDVDVARYFDFDLKSAAVPLDFSPFRKQITIEETDEYIIYVDQFGIKKKELKKLVAMPLFMEYPVKDRGDFDLIRNMYTDRYEERLYPNWVGEVKRYRREGYVVWLYNDFWGFFGVLRQLMGLERLSIMFYDDPKFIKDILEFYTGYTLKFWSYILGKVKVDYALIWEDMAYKKTSMISPLMFKEFLLPYYKQLAHFLKNNGVDKVFVDCDGNVEVLIPLWIEGGVDGVYPMEVQAGMNVADIRKKYPELLICGGIDKKALARTKQDIDRELEKAEFVLKSGGYIPFVDHAIPVDVSWENFKYYRTKLNYLIDKHRVA